MERGNLCQRLRDAAELNVGDRVRENLCAEARVVIQTIQERLTAEIGRNDYQTIGELRAAVRGILDWLQSETGPERRENGHAS